MPPNELKCLETMSWLKKACEDIDSAKILYQADKLSQSHQVLFFCQQTVEKAMKAFLFWHSVKFRRSHDLSELGLQCITIDSSLVNKCDKVAYLSDYAWEFRYPGEDPEPTKDEAKAGIIKAEKFLNVIIAKLPKETQP